jgi:MFS family permease
MILFGGAQDPNAREQEIKLMFKVAWFTQILINLDHGIIPACTSELKKDLGLDEVGLGALGSLVYLGLICGSLTAGPMFQSFSSKRIICFATLCNLLFLLIFPVAENLFWLGLSRVGVGFFQVFLVIYFPVWVDLYGGENKTLWITYLQVAVPLGVFLGYLLTSQFVLYLSWKWSFFTQVVLLIPCVVLFCYFDSRNMTTNSEEDTRKQSINGVNEGARDQYLLSFSMRLSMTADDIKEFMIGSGNSNDNPNAPHIVKEDEDELHGEKLSYLNNLALLWDRKVFVYTMLSISSLYFVVTGIQFWISDYLRAVLMVPMHQVFMSFSIVSITGPTMGVLFGGAVVSRFGGYSSKPALTICLIFGTLASVFGLPIPFLNDFPTLVVFLWLVLFFGGALMPPVMGIMLSSIPKSMRAFGNSAAQILQNMLGYFPAPFVYGMVCKFTGGEKSRWGMILLMFWSLFGIVGLAFAKKHQELLRSKKMERIKRHDAHDDTMSTDAESRKEELLSPVERQLAKQNRKAYKYRKPSTDYVPPVDMDPKLYKELKNAVIDFNTLPTENKQLLTKENLENLGMMMGRAGRTTLRRKTITSAGAREDVLL